jgi:hypothetical protein
MQRLKYTEALQTVAELRSQLAQIESKVFFLLVKKFFLILES